MSFNAFNKPWTYNNSLYTSLKSVNFVKVNEDANVDPRFTSTSIGVEKFLDLASSNNYNDYCLAYVFTQRDFDNGVLGLAWVGGVGLYLK